MAHVAVELPDSIIEQAIVAGYGVAGRPWLAYLSGRDCGGIAMSDDAWQAAVEAMLSCGRLFYSGSLPVMGEMS